MRHPWILILNDPGVWLLEPLMAFGHKALLDSSIHEKLSGKQDHILLWFENSMAAMSRVNGTQSYVSWELGTV